MHLLSPVFFGESGRGGAWLGKRATLSFMKLRGLLPVFVAALAVGCIEGGIGEPGDPVVSNDPPSVTAEEDTGTAATGDVTGSTSSDDSGAPATEDSSVPPPPSDSSAPDTKPPADTSVADTSVADTAKPDTAPPPADTAPPPTDDWPAANAALEQGILEEVNKRRAAGASCGTKGSFGPAGALVMQFQLQAAARKHSKDMATQNYFAHDNLAGKTPFDRMKAEGYKGGTMGENIAAGNATVAATMDQWMKSDGHCANIMNKSYTQLGVGYWYSATSSYRHYWTQNFGAGG